MKSLLIVALLLSSAAFAAPKSTTPKVKTTKEDLGPKSETKVDAKTDTNFEVKTQKSFEFLFPKQSQELVMIITVDKDTIADLESCKIETFTPDVEFKLNCYLDARVKLLETFLLPESIFVDMRATGLFTEDKLVEPKPQVFEWGNVYSWASPSKTATNQFYVCPNDVNHCFRVRTHDASTGLTPKFEVRGAIKK